MESPDGYSTPPQHTRLPGCKSILVSGIGIAVPTLAYWLGERGFNRTLIESAPRLRAGGYLIELLGLGCDIAERMGLLRDLKSEGYVIQEMPTENSRGRRIGGSDVDVFRRLVRGRYVSISRSSLSRMIYPSAIAMAKLVGWANASQKIGYAFHGSHKRLVGMTDQQMGAQSSGIECPHLGLRSGADCRDRGDSAWSYFAA